MAVFATNVSFDLFSIDLNYYVRSLAGAQFFNNSYLVVNGVTYEDAYQVDSVFGDSIIFFGNSFTRNNLGDITGGSVELVGEVFNGSVGWILQNFSYSATSFYSAAYTSSNSDELSIVRSILSGNDLIFLSSGGDRIDAYGGNDEVIGNGGNDTLYGGDGNDSISGGAGNDYLDAGGGVDTATYSSATAAVRVSLSTSNSQNTGGDGSDRLLSFENLTGSDFDDFLEGSSSNNTIAGGLGNDDLLGLAGTDSLSGGDGADTLSGGAGSDTLNGGAGTDWIHYRYDAAVAVDLSLTSSQNTGGGGTDAIVSIENLGGSLFNDNLKGNFSANFLFGNDGNDTLEGGGGSDTLQGGRGDDRYILNSAGARVEEFNGAGTDLVIASVSFTLPANVENLLLSGGSGVAGTGNALSNLLEGNAGDNTLTGGGGSDTLVGGGGTDTLRGGTGGDLYRVDSESDVVVESSGAGNDTVEALSSYTLPAAVERLQLTGAGPDSGTGNGLNNFLGGNAAANSLRGAGGQDTLAGGAGQDTLSGGAGADVFVFDSALNAGSNVDIVSDFQAGSDKLRLQSSVFSSLTGGQPPGEGEFLSAPGAADALTTDHRIIYDSASGNLYYDADGSGNSSNAVQFATLQGAPAISAADFVIAS